MPPTLTANSAQILAGAIAQRLYGFRPTALTPLGAARSSVFRVEFGGLPPKVIKLPGSVRALQREQRILRALRHPRWRMPVPAVEMTERDLPAEWAIGVQAFKRPAVLSVMRHVPGMSLADAILRGEPWAADAIHSAGALAGRLECLPMTILAQRRLPGGLAVLSHGALFLSSILVTPAPAGPCLCVVGWTRARAAAPGSDLNCLLASLAQLPIHDPGLLAYLRRRAIDGYSALRPPAGELHERPQRGGRAANVLVP